MNPFEARLHYLHAEGDLGITRWQWQQLEAYCIIIKCLSMYSSDAQVKLEVCRQEEVWQRLKARLLEGGRVIANFGESEAAYLAFSNVFGGALAAAPDCRLLNIDVSMNGVGLTIALARFHASHLLCGLTDIS